MHRFNVIAMAVIVSLSVVVAYSVRAANSAELVPQMTPMQDAMWIEQMSLPIQELPPIGNARKKEEKEATDRSLHPVRR